LGSRLLDGSSFGLGSTHLRLIGLGHELDHGHRRVVTLAGSELGDAGVTTRTLSKGRRDLREQHVDDTLVADGLEDLATVVQVALLCLGDQLRRDRAQATSLGLGRDDPAVLEELGGQVRQDEPLVGGAAAEAGSLGGSRHCVLSFLLGRIRYRDSPAVSGTGNGNQYCSSSTNEASSSSL